MWRAWDVIGGEYSRDTMTRANGSERNPVRKAQARCDTDVAKEFGLPCRLPR